MSESTDNLVVFKKCGDNIEASGLRALLSANGIYCVIQGEQHRALLGTLGPYIELNVLVSPQDVERAEAVVTAAEEAGQDERLLEEAAIRSASEPHEVEPTPQEGDTSQRVRAWLIFLAFIVVPLLLSLLLNL